MSVVATLFEPRWHGFARYEIELREPGDGLHHGDHVYQSTPLESGWMRRKRGSNCVSLVAESDRWQTFYLTGETHP